MNLCRHLRKPTHFDLELLQKEVEKEKALQVRHDAIDRTDEFREMDESEDEANYRIDEQEELTMPEPEDDNF